MPIKCPKCQTSNPHDSKYCKECATPLPSEEAPLSKTSTLETPSEEFVTGSTFAGRYQIIEELGSGGMGRVFRVLDKKLNEEIAVKIIRPEIASNKKALERFNNELKIARKIIHKNVCRMYEFMEDNGTHFITMEYIPGEDLKSFIRKSRQLSISTAIIIVKQVCEGLAEAHRLKVIHRDLKPSNIMIDNEGSVHIMDFGIARILEAKGITRDGIAIGTPEYMSPEQVEGKELDQRSDIYALGTIFYEIVTGRMPFEGTTSLSLALKHKTDTPPDPRQFNSEITEVLSHVILKCMEKDREKRYQSAEVLLTELISVEDAITRGEKVLPRKKTAPVLSGKRLRARWITAFILIALLIAIVGYVFLGRVFEPGETRWKNSIAVLPFEDQSPQRDQEPFCEEMTLDIIKNLSSIKDLKVSPFYTMRRYKKSVKGNEEIGKELNVKSILISYFKKEGEKIRVVAELVNAEEGYIIESFDYDEELSDILNIQDRLSKEIAIALGVRLGDAQLVALKQGEPEIPQAYEAYAKGSHFERKYRDHLMQSDFDAAVKYFKHAIAIDDHYALPYWGLGLVYETRSIEEGNLEYVRLMEENYLKAYQINPELPEANVGLGWVSFHREDMDSAYQYFKRAYIINPNDAEINVNVAAFLRDLGLHRRALQIYTRAIELDPVSSFYRMITAHCYRNNGEFEKAVTLLKEALELDPDNIGLRLFYARQLIMTKKYTKADEEIARVEKTSKEDLETQYTRAWIHAVKGEREKALEIIHEPADPVLYTYILSNIYAILGMEDKAIQNIEIALEKAFPERKTYAYPYTYLIKNHFYDNLRDIPRFKEIVRKQEKTYRERLRKYGDL